jgi:hypothetical protein
MSQLRAQRISVVTGAWLITLVSTGAAQPLRPEVRGCPALEDGGLLLTDSETGDCDPAPVLETDVSIAVTGIIARARVTQKFRNPGDGWVEGIYVFSLPDGAAVDHLRMSVGRGCPSPPYSRKHPGGSPADPSRPHEPRLRRFFPATACRAG